MIDGIDIRSMDLSFLRSCITVIPKDPVIFTGTLRFNLDPEGRAGDSQINELIAAAKLDGLYRKLGEGLDSKLVGEAPKMTVGEQQIVCLCRAILKRNKIVILEGMPANMDELTE